MVGRDNGRAHKVVLCDMNTQHDFLGNAATCKVRNADEFIPAARRVIAWAKWNHVPVVSCIDSHRHIEGTHDGFPPHCIEGSPGQHKMPWSLFGTRVRIECDNTLSVPLTLFNEYQQVIFRKRSHDLFGNPKADRFLTQLPAEEYIIYGVGLEYSLNFLAMGLLARNKKVTVVADACGYWNSTEGDLALRRLHAKGADLVSVEQLLHRRLRPRLRYSLHGNGSNGHSGNGSNGHSSNGRSNGNGNGRARSNGRA